MPRPKVFVSRRIPDEGLNRIAAACEVDEAGKCLHDSQ